MSEFIKVKVPAKIMLAGEYSVLFGHKALALSLDSFLVVTIKKSQDKFTTIDSNIWDKPFKLNPTTMTISDEPLVKSVVDSISRMKHFFNETPVDILVESKIKIKDGIGSSSALRLAIAIALKAFFNQATQNIAVNKIHDTDSYLDEIFHALNLQRESQPQASGYDIYTQFHGGITEFTPPDICKNTKHISKLEALSSIIHPFVGGRGAPTSQVMQTTLKWFKDLNTQNKKEFFKLSDKVCDQLWDITSHNDINYLNNLVKNISHLRKFFIPSPEFPKHIEAKLQEVKKLDDTWSYKTTGAGGEDALLLCGTLDNLQPAIQALKELGWYKLPYNFTNDGTTISTGGE